MSEYVIHPDGSVSHLGRIVGECLTGEDGRAYVQFFRPEDMPADPDTKFAVYGNEWAAT